MSLSRFLILSCCLLLASCGTEQYEARLLETNAFFEYRQSLDKVLQSQPWNGPNTITMRIPHGFKLLPPPAPPKEGEPPALDSRQPAAMGFMPLELPGLVAAWRGDFPCDGRNLPAFLYVCSNHHLFHASATNGAKPPEPELFLTELENTLGAAMQVEIKPLEAGPIRDNTRYAEVCPREQKYALSKHFTGIALVPPGVLPQVGIALKGQYYGHYNGKIHVGILAIYPASIRERMDEKLRTALETFSVSAAIPQAVRPKTPGVPGAAPTQPSGF